MVDDDDGLGITDGISVKCEIITGVYGQHSSIFITTIQQSLRIRQTIVPFTCIAVYIQCFCFYTTQCNLGIYLAILFYQLGKKIVQIFYPGGKTERLGICRVTPGRIKNTTNVQ